MSTKTYDIILTYEDRERTFTGEKRVDIPSLQDMKAKGLLKKYKILEH